MLTLATVLSYVLIHGSTNKIMTSANVNIQAALARRSEYGGEFLWFRTREGSYVIRDAATLARIDHFFDAERELDPEAERLRARLRPLEDRERELDHLIDAIEDHEGGDRTRLATLKSEMRDVEGRLRVLEREEEDLDHRRDAREAEAERRMFSILPELVRNGVAQPASR